MHNIITWNYDLGTKPKSIQIDAETLAKRDGDGLYCDIKFNDLLFDNEEKALEYLNRKTDSGDYYCGAVKYLEYPNLPKSKHYEDLEQRLGEWNKKYNDLRNKIHYANVKASFVSCPSCNSKINKEFIKWNYCPICRNDMRPKSTLDTIKRYEEICNDLKKQLKIETLKLQEKNKKKAITKWLVRFEYHS